MGVFGVGDRVEARMEGENELWFTADVIGGPEGVDAAEEEEAEPEGDGFDGGRAMDEDAGPVYALRYETGLVEARVPRGRMRRSSRVEVWSDERFLVEDGRLTVGGVDRRCRLLRFKGCPGFYQSCVLLEGRGEPRGTPAAVGFDRTYLPFECNQAFGVGLSFLETERGAGRRFAVWGGAGGTFPMTVAAILPGAVVDVVELDGGVVDVARAHLGYRDRGTPGGHRNLATHVEDALAFCRRTAASGETPYDLICCDVLSEGAGRGEEEEVALDPTTGEPELEAPPPGFVERAFVAGPLWDSLREDDGLLVMNVIAGRRKLVEVARTLADVFGEACVYCLVTDPGYYFFAFRRTAPIDPPLDHTDVLSRCGRTEEPWCVALGLAHLPLVRDEVAKTEDYAAQKSICGWFPFRRLVRMLCDTSFQA